MGEARRPRRFLPFSTGLRSCIGQNLAKMNYTATLAVLLSRYSFELPKEVSPQTLGRQEPGVCQQQAAD